MPTIADQLQELINQKKSLVSNLNTKGVTASEDEKLNTLVPKVLEIPTSGGGIDTSDATASENDILLNKTAYVKGKKLTGTIKSKSASTYTPSTEDQVISSGQYLSGNQTIKGDLNLSSENIKKGIIIFGSEGTFTSDATATENDILSNKTAYVNGEKVTGNISTIEDKVIITPSNKNQELESAFYNNGITVLGDTNLVATNIKKGIKLFGVTGTFEGSGSTGSDEQVIFECDPEATDTEIVETWGSLVKTKMGTDYDDLKTYVYNTICAISYNANSTDLISGISYKNQSTSNDYGFYFITPVSISSSTVLFYIRGFVSTWINPDIIIHFIQADSIDDIQTKISNKDYAYSKQIQIPNSINSTHSNITSLILYFNLDNMTLSGEYYLFIEVPATGGNDCIMNKIVLINK